MYSLKDHESLESQGGFTLVELAVVMIIIGLLIGGVLKGQELISNAQVTATVAQVEGYNAASTTFRDIYDAIPGDLTNPDVRLPGCAAVAECNVPGNGNGRVDDAGAAAPPDAAPVGEALTYFPHISAADLISGVNAPDGATWGGIFPEAELGGAGFHIGYDDGAAALGMNGAPRAGHYLALVRDAGGVPAAGMTPSEAFRIDSKLDDGIAITGSVFSGADAAGGAATDCLANAAPGDYNTAFQGDNCFLYLRF